MIYIVLFSHGKVLECPKGEALFWAWMSDTTSNCDVYAASGSCVPLSPFDIR